MRLSRFFGFCEWLFTAIMAPDGFYLDFNSLIHNLMNNSVAAVNPFRTVARKIAHESLKFKKGRVGTLFYIGDYFKNFIGVFFVICSFSNWSKASPP